MDLSTFGLLPLYKSISSLRDSHCPAKSDHLMGAAFGEGMISYLKQMGWKVADAVHINAFQAADIEADKSQRKVPGTSRPDAKDPEHTL